MAAAPTYVIEGPLRSQLTGDRCTDCGNTIEPGEDFYLRCTPVRGEPLCGGCMRPTEEAESDA